MAAAVSVGAAALTRAELDSAVVAASPQTLLSKVIAAERAQHEAQEQLEKELLRADRLRREWDRERMALSLEKTDIENRLLRADVANREAQQESARLASCLQNAERKAREAKARHEEERQQLQDEFAIREKVLKEESFLFSNRLRKSIVMHNRVADKAQDLLGRKEALLGRWKTAMLGSARYYQVETAGLRSRECGLVSRLRQAQPMARA
eukprot:scaffold2083_cov419-Prasinococcus_capsulatus_cf.AAC.5